MSGNELAIEVRGLTRSFRADPPAVNSVDLDVPRGGVYALLGTNGAGKTTTVRMLATLDRPDSGSAKIFGHDITAEPGIVRSMIGVTGQYASVDEDLTATENLLIFARLVGATRRRARTRAAALLDEFGLSQVGHRRVQTFSGGMRRRLDLAASMITRPRLLFLDEPTTGLDPRTRMQMWDTVRDLVAAGSTVLLTTQYLDEADHLADRIAVMDRGRLVAEGSADQLKSRVGETCVKLTLADPTQAVEAQHLSDPFSQGEPTVDLGQQARVAVPMPTVDKLPELLLALRAADIELAAVNVEKPTLDEVFFALTDALPGAAA